MSRWVVVVAAAAALAGCGGGESEGEATLWVTRDRGERVLLTAEVDAGQTAMQALDSETDLETRYGGRFVQAIDGVEGSLGRRVDWFYFVNGYEGDRSAAEYRLRAGDVVWFDHRSWSSQMRVPVVVGAFPEPFLHGFAGERRATVVRYAGPELETRARRLGRLLRARDVRPLNAGRIPRDAHVVAVLGDRAKLARARLRHAGDGPGSPVWLTLNADLERLVDDPRYLRFRYQGAP